jgi:hypothetical protein
MKGGDTIVDTPAVCLELTSLLGRFEGRLGNSHFKLQYIYLGCNLMQV